MQTGTATTVTAEGAEPGRVPVPWETVGRVADDLLDCIGRTPLVRLARLEVGGPRLLAKIEYFSPTGSLKDRIYKRMITQAIARGDLRPGMTILECSTGNAGIACAFVGARLGFPVVVIMPAGMSEERKKIIRAYGADLVETPGGESDVDLCLEEARRRDAVAPGTYWVPDQFSNRDNVATHYETTGPEIWEQSGGTVDILVASQGTGGVVSGVGRYLRERHPAVKLYAVEPTEAPLLSQRTWGSHKIEGIGDGFVPRNLDLSLLDGIVATPSDDAIAMARRAAREEGLFCGISSGCNLLAARMLAQRFPDARSVVTIVNDTGQRYFSTELCGADKHVDVPEREHPIDSYTQEQLDQYQAAWDVVS